MDTFQVALLWKRPKNYSYCFLGTCCYQNFNFSKHFRI